MNVEDIKKQFQEDLAAAQDAAGVEALRVKYLGRKGAITGLFSRMGSLTQEERKAFGQGVNALKSFIEEELSKKEGFGSAPKDETDIFDITLPGTHHEPGTKHPLTSTLDEICGIFTSMGFQIFHGPEIETEAHNFQALNIPLDHPSRDSFDTFYIQSPVASHQSPVKNNFTDIPGKTGHGTGRPGTVDCRLLLRSHTSPAQIRVMSAYPPPVACIVPGKVYRPDATDASHSFEFHQVEGFFVDEGVRFSDLKGILEAFLKRMFGENVKTRFRPSFFPFTEPSAEVDMSCIICGGKGCSVCSKTGWLEVMGCGMIHPHVFSAVGYDAKKYSGFAFGMGVERLCMLKSGVDDIRMFFENNIQFLRQF